MKTAVVLFNLGGPDSLEAVKPFLFNLFSDKAILRLPQPFRHFLAWLISTRRAPLSQEIYRKMGGASPILSQTRDQAEKLASRLGERGRENFKVFIAMRYWHPMSAETIRDIKAWGADRVVLTPLYPQYSTTTTGSSYAAWKRAATAEGLDVPTSLVCCYPENAGFIDAYQSLLREGLREVEGYFHRVLFSAHGLPERIVKAGDPYQWQVERTVAAIVGRGHVGSLDYVTCYQSRVGPVRWIGPSTEAEIRRAGGEGKAVVVVPVAFVSEHSETLVELDMDYRDLAENVGVPRYYRVPTVQSHPSFINALADMVKDAEATGVAAAGETCPEEFSGCACREGRA